MTDEWTKQHHLHDIDDWPETKIVDAANEAEPPYELKDSRCKNPDCGRKIENMAFRGTDFCSIDCEKAVGKHQTSVGTNMFVSFDERDKILEDRDAAVRTAT